MLAFQTSSAADDSVALPLRSNLDTVASALARRPLGHESDNVVGGLLAAPRLAILSKR
jgi:hypothetical protein